ncbi:HAD family hydrolase [Leptospira biflexa]|uniref:D-glycero-alpha-D-manno-heptose-1,7-bisphosphate 7-phosphatase n=1 Tax=Leptospira biflexa TaxID=172 RepID=UPI0010830BFB|nr:HAD family hydrolase [Leptospira biflexa]TGM31717.1 HAD family hydrolase [Leptospira biflexa]TGM39124.1 HAD family hydrolase [Leptospira biflexa]TGM44536.1 HAD family hydrolase [Leptospira biflexa]TGM45423.1 HAD family hydrolase [Leptospira biflexa]
MNDRALFLDRDGIINEDFDYVYKIEDFQFKSEIFELCRIANQKGYLIFVITNQAGIARGFYSERDFLRLTNWMISEFEKQNCKIKRVYYSPYHPDVGDQKYKRNSSFRKPNPGMILKAQKRYSIDLTNSVLVGDQNTDVEAGVAAGIQKNFLLFNENKKNLTPHLKAICVKNLNEVIPFL